MSAMRRPFRRDRAHRLALASLAALAVVSACGGDQSDADPRALAAPEAIRDREDPVCGMLTREQPAPRAQIVHRDGERAFPCSIGDLLVALDAPSAHGRAAEVFVEVLAVDEDPSVASRDAHAWRRAEEATFVVGIVREGVPVMGPPVLAYASREDALAVAGRHAGASTLDFAALRAWFAARQRDGR